MLPHHTKMALIRTLIRWGAAAVCGGCALGHAQPRPVIVRVTVPEVLNLTVDRSTVTLALAAADYDAQTGRAVKLAAAATTFRVSSNRDWRLTVRPGNPSFSFIPAGSSVDPHKSVNALALRTGGGAYLPFTGVAELSVSAGRGGGYSQPGNVIPVDYQFTSALETDPPGVYLLTLTFTVVAQ